MKTKTTSFKVLLKTKNVPITIGIITFLAFSVGTNAQTSYDSNAVPISGGAENCAFGPAALASPSSTGDGNVALGAKALGSDTSGSYNTATGHHAMILNRSGDSSVANGTSALYNNTSGSLNVAVGADALYSNVTGGINTATGSYALYTNDSGNGNSAYGFTSLSSNTSGRFNVAIGANTLVTNTSGNFNSALGFLANVSSGALSNATAIGFQAVVNASNKVRIGSTTVTVVEGPVAYTFSDGRFKNNVNEDDAKGLEFIKKLRPVVYNLDTKKITEFWTKNMPDSIRKQHMNQDFTASTNIRQSGFIAQEVEKAAKDVNYDFSGVHVPDNADDNYSLAYSEFVVPLVKGMQEQQKMIEDQKQMIENLQQQINDLKAQGSNVGMNQSSSMELAPNPFSHSTVVSFNLAEQISTACMKVYDLSGKQLKTIPISQRGASSITISSDELAAGVYICSIVGNGKVLGSKRMVVTGK